MPRTTPARRPPSPRRRGRRGGSRGPRSRGRSRAAPSERPTGYPPTAVRKAPAYATRGMPSPRRARATGSPPRSTTPAMPPAARACSSMRCRCTWWSVKGGSDTPCSPVRARWQSAASGPSSSPQRLRVVRSSQLCPHRVQLGEEGQVERALKERHAARSAGARLEPDDALHRLEVAEAPELEVVFQVDELLARLVRRPMRSAGRGRSPRTPAPAPGRRSTPSSRRARAGRRGSGSPTARAARGTRRTGSAPRARPR